MSTENEEIILRTYSSVWKIERKIHSIEGLKLIFPIAVSELTYLGVSIGITFLLIKIVPFFSRLHFIIKFILFPLGLMKLLTSIKLDGKLPHRFISDYIVFKFSPKQYCRFTSIQDYKNIKFVTPILFREYRIVNKTDEVSEKNTRRRLVK